MYKKNMQYLTWNKQVAHFQDGCYVLGFGTVEGTMPRLKVFVSRDSGRSTANETVWSMES